MEPPAEAVLRQTFKRFNPLMIFMWRLGMGRFINAWPEVGGRIMVLAHTGRQSGVKRYAPVNYAVVNDELYCTAGFGSVSDWYRNLLANPKVEVWLPNGWWSGTAEDVSKSARRLMVMRQVLIGSGAVARMVGIDPIRMTDSQLDAATANYPLIHIHRTEARTGPGGPDDLMWVWPALVAILALALPWALRQRRRNE